MYNAMHQKNAILLIAARVTATLALLCAKTYDTGPRMK